MARPECDPFRVAIQAVELMKQQKVAEYDLAIQLLRDLLNQCEADGVPLPPPPLDGPMPAGHEGPDADLDMGAPR